MERVSHDSVRVSTCLNMSQNVSTGSYRFMRAILVIQENGSIQDDGPRERLRPARRLKVLVYRDDLTSLVHKRKKTRQWKRLDMPHLIIKTQNHHLSSGNLHDDRKSSFSMEEPSM